MSLLFSDMEGSTRLLGRLGAEYAAALDMHRRILTEAWAAYGVTDLGTEGDSFYGGWAIWRSTWTTSRVAWPWSGS